MDEPSPLDRAIAKAGGASKLAAALGVAPSAVSNWRRGGIPPARVGHIAALAGMAPHEVAPALFPPPAPSEAA
jgi:DNA-binding transcriptional regulator YdaS (Cro superfamily)